MKQKIGIAFVLAGLFLIAGATGGADLGAPISEYLKYWGIGLILLIDGYLLTKKGEDKWKDLMITKHATQHTKRRSRNFRKRLSA